MNILNALLHFVPIYGTKLTYDELTDESIPYYERVVIAAGAGLTSFGHLVVIDKLTGHVPTWPRHVATKAPVVTATAALGAMTYAVTKKGATVEYGPYGSVRVTPKLGMF